mgnify:CR=1 FL=1
MAKKAKGNRVQVILECTELEADPATLFYIVEFLAEEVNVKASLCTVL